MKRCSSLRERLDQAGIYMASDDREPGLETPWFVRALQALSGWLAALFLLAFIAVGAAIVIENSAASAALGLAMIAVAYALLRMTPGDFVEHLALVISLAGQLLLAWAMGTGLDDVSAGFWGALLGLQALLALTMPSLIHRTFSAFAASLALYMALVEATMHDIAGGLMLLALTGIWLNEFRWPARIRWMQAQGYGLLLGLLVIQAAEAFGQPLLAWRHGADIEPLAWVGFRIGPWLSDALTIPALLLLLRQVFQRHAIDPAKRVAAYGAVCILMLASYQAHGLIQGATVLALGFALGNRLMMGAGGIAILCSIASYYYLLDASLLIKALSLFVTGAVLLAIRGVMRHWWWAKEGGQ